MKAVLVIDLDDDVNLDEWSAVKVIVDRIKVPYEEMLKGITFDESKTFKFVPLKPMPQKTSTRNNPLFSADYSKGWNDCIKEITGETE